MGKEVYNNFGYITIDGARIDGTCNAMDYGNVPQNRERIYIVCFKDKKNYERFEFPKKIKLTKK